MFLRIYVYTLVNIASPVTYLACCIRKNKKIDTSWFAEVPSLCHGGAVRRVLENKNLESDSGEIGGLTFITV